MTTYTPEVAKARGYLELATKGYCYPDLLEPIKALVIFQNAALLLDDHARLAEENAELRRALQFYADADNWEMDRSGSPDQDHEVEIDNHGDTARAALADLEVQNG